MFKVLTKKKKVIRFRLAQMNMKKVSERSKIILFLVKCFIFYLSCVLFLSKDIRYNFLK